MPSSSSTSHGAESRSAWIAALIGVLLAPGAPLGLWVVFELASEPLPATVARYGLIYSGVATAIAFGSFGWITGRLLDRQRAAALHDGLTGLFNRRFMRESLPQLQATESRRGTPLCVVMLDLDHFKRVNDEHGHLIGDQTLCAVSDTLRAHSRKSDLVARYGGEEFAVLCPGTDCETGMQVAERLRAAVAALGAEQLGHPGPQTISLGVAVQSPGTKLTPEQLLEHADSAMYQAKRLGRDRAVAWLDGRPYTRAG